MNYGGMFQFEIKANISILFGIVIKATIIKHNTIIIQITEKHTGPGQGNSIMYPTIQQQAEHKV